MVPLAALVLAGVASALQIEPAKDAPRPSPPEESLKHFRVAKGFRVELVASEPLLADPSSIAFDARGRLFVGEIHGYNLEGHLDIQELNKTGKLDRKVRRITARPELIRAARERTYGTIKLLEDTDADGRMDRATLFADRIPACYGMVPWRDGLIAVCAPDILYLADRDGDGKADVRKRMFTGFRVRVLERAPNNPRWGPDNWIYVAAGGVDSTITGPGLDDPVRLGRVDFRFKPDGSALEPVTGQNGTFGLALTDFGDRFLITTNQHARYAIPLPHRYLVRNPYVRSPRTTEGASGYQNIFPDSRPHPWRVARGKDPAWVRFYGSRETASGSFTSACGQTIYRAAAFPGPFQGNHFCCDPQQNLVHRSVIERDGAGFRVRRPAGDERREFLTSTATWFRPINLRVGPEGALYVVDFHREIIEDYSAIPRYLQQQYGLIKGNDRGRIWRVVHEKATAARKVDLADGSTERLVRELAGPNFWWRMTAQRLLIERRAQDAAGALRARVREGDSPAARLHALYTLDGLGVLRAEDLAPALRDPHYAVRLHALRLGDRAPELIGTIADMVDDPDPVVRLQVAMSLGEARDGRTAGALATLALRRGNERWMRAAILSSAAETAERMLAALLEAGRDLEMVGPLTSILGARHRVEEIDRTLGIIADLEGGKAGALQASALKGLVEGLKHGKLGQLPPGKGRKALLRLLANPAAEVRGPAFRLVALFRLEGSPELEAAFGAAAEVALDARRSLPERRAAVALLASAPFPLKEKTVKRLLDARVPIELQLAAVDALSTSDAPPVAPILLAGWKGYSPRVRESVLEAIFRRDERLPALLEAVENGTVHPSGLAGIRRARLVEHPEPGVREKAKRLLATPARAGRDKAMGPYLAALASPGRNGERGEAVFKNLCGKCHRLGGEGHAVGPDLTALGPRPDRAWLAEILWPGDRIAEGYRSYLVRTKSGDTFAGTLASESATSLTLRMQEGKEVTVLRKDVDAMAGSDVSMMPENMTELLSPRDAADLLIFLRERLGPAPPGRMTLFEDDPAFVKALTEGGGKASLRTDSPFSGTAALAVTPLQRHAPRIPGWSYRIVEKPKPGEYRYLRLAWRSIGGEGVMVELAADGSWPPAGRPVRRYYSGTNTTKWRARRVSKRVPAEWTVVTMDLWKDCGEFTLTGIAPTAMGGPALFDRIELLRELK